MTPLSPWCQNQTRVSEKRKLQANITDKHRYKKSSAKFQQTRSNCMLKGSITIIKWYLSQECKVSSVYPNQAIWYTTSTTWKMKTTWSCQKIQRKLLTMQQQGRISLRGQTCWHSGGRREWDELREYHGNIYIPICKTDSQCEFDVWCRELKSSYLWQPIRVRGGGR